MTRTRILKQQFPFNFQSLTLSMSNLQKLILCLLLSIPINTFSQELRLLFVGDVMQHDAQLESAYNERLGRYHYKPWFRFIKPIIEKADIAVANLELTLAGPPYSGYPQFCAPDELAVALKDAGFDYLITANNHSCDKGKKGIERTLDVLDSLQIPHTGTFRNTKERMATYPLIIEKNDISVAILNYTYGTNGIEPQYPNIVNYIDTNQIKRDLQFTKLKGVDQIIVTIHWGMEYKRFPGIGQLAIENFCYKYGADMVIGSHAHVVQPLHRTVLDDDREVLTAYSLGNFISNQRRRYTDGGIILWIGLKKDPEGKVSIDTAGYIPTWVYVNKRKDKSYFYILPGSGEGQAGKQGTLEKKDKDRMNRFIEDTRSHLNAANKNVPELSIDYISNLKPSEKKGVRYLFHVLLAKSVKEDYINQLPAYIRKHVNKELIEGEFYNLSLGNYIIPEVADAIKDRLEREGLKGLKVITSERIKK